MDLYHVCFSMFPPTFLGFYFIKDFYFHGQAHCDKGHRNLCSSWIIKHITQGAYTLNHCFQVYFYCYHQSFVYLLTKKKSLVKLCKVFTGHSLFCFYSEVLFTGSIHIKHIDLNLKCWVYLYIFIRTGTECKYQSQDLFLFMETAGCFSHAKFKQYVKSAKL